MAGLFLTFTGFDNPHSSRCAFVGVALPRARKGKPMCYSDFETRLLLALAAAAADSSQPSAFVVAETVAPQVNPQWVRAAVRSFEQRGYFHSVVRPAHVSTIFMAITAEGRKAAQKIVSTFSRRRTVTSCEPLW
jgi:hypothetical protein